MSDKNGNVNPNIPDDDEISLVDLLAVLIRFRRMILGGTVLVLIASIVWLYGLPAAGLASQAPPTYTAKIDLEVRSVPEALDEHVTLDVLARAQTLLRDRQVTGAELTVTYDRASGIISFTTSDTDRDAAVRSLSGVADAANAALAERLNRDLDEAEQRARARIAAVERSLQTVMHDAPATDRIDEASPDGILRYLTLAVTMENAVQSVRADADLLEQIRIVRERPCLICPVSAEPLVTREATGNRRSVRVVVSTVAALFLLIFIAFVRQYIRTVAADAEESRKLRDAWKG